MNTHVLLISGQVIPNLTPLLDPQIRPDSVIMLVSEDMKTRANWLRDVIRPQGIHCEMIRIENPYDIQQIQVTVTELIIENSDKQLILNATGGTKPMSIAAYEEFRLENLPIYYVHPETDLMIWLHDKNRPDHQIADRVKLENFMAAHGANVSKIKRGKPDQDDIELAEKIIHDIAYFNYAVTELNFLAQTAQGILKSEKIKPRNTRNQAAFDDLIDIFSIAGYLTVKNHQLIFHDEPKRFFVNGGWIECWVYEAIRQFRKETSEIHDTAYNLEIQRRLPRGKPVKNEIDAAFLYNNRLHIIECKTRKMTSNESTGAETLYKLEALKPIMGGLQARALLVSLLDIPDRDKTRASELKIRVCSGVQLKNLSEHLTKFIS